MSITVLKCKRLSSDRETIAQLLTDGESVWLELIPSRREHFEGSAIKQVFHKQLMTSEDGQREFEFFDTITAAE